LGVGRFEGSELIKGGAQAGVVKAGEELVERGQGALDQGRDVLGGQLAQTTGEQAELKLDQGVDQGHDGAEILYTKP
jgi:hypothetical protein